MLRCDNCVIVTQKKRTDDESDIDTTYVGDLVCVLGILEVSRDRVLEAFRMEDYSGD